MNILKKYNCPRSLLIFIFLAIFLRTINIISEQIWADEATSIFFAKSSFDKFWELVIEDIHPPLYYLILKGWISIFGASILSCRLLSVIFSVLIIPFLYLAGKELKNEKLGIIIIFLYAISPFSIYYANEIRSYSLLHLLFTMDVYISIRCLKKPKIFKNYLIHSLCGILLIYTHYTGIVYFALISIIILILNKNESLSYRNNFFSILITILSYIPWIPYAIDDFLGGAHGYAGGPLTLINLLYWGFYFFIAPVPSNINDPYILNLIILTFLINIPSFCILVLSLIGLFFSYKNKYHTNINKLFYFFVIITFLLFGTSIILGFVFEDTFTARNLIGGLSLIHILQGFGLYYLIFNGQIGLEKIKKFLNMVKHPSLIKTIYIIFTILLLVNLIVYPIFRAYYLQKPDWNGCIKTLKKEIEDDDVVIMGFKGGDIPYTMQYYSDANNFDLKEYFYELNYNEDDIEEFLDDITKDNKTRIWIVKYWQELRDPEDKTEDMLIDEYNLKKIDEYSFRLDISLILYEIS